MTEACFLMVVVVVMINKFVTTLVMNYDATGKRVVFFSVHSVLNFIPIGATCRPCGAKNTQNRPLNNFSSGACAARDAAGKN